MLVDKAMQEGVINLKNLRDIVDDWEEEDPYCQKHDIHIPDSMLEAFMDAMDLKCTQLLEPEDMIGILKSKK